MYKPTIKDLRSALSEGFFTRLKENQIGHLVLHLEKKNYAAL